MTTLYYVKYGQGLEYEGDEPPEDSVLIGIYSTEEKAQQAIDRLKDNPLFSKYPNGFRILYGKMNRGGWETGFVSFAEALDSLSDD